MVRGGLASRRGGHCDNPLLLAPIISALPNSRHREATMHLTRADFGLLDFGPGQRQRDDSQANNGIVWAVNF